jgi:hypothetical protein
MLLQLMLEVGMQRVGEPAFSPFSDFVFIFVFPKTRGGDFQRKVQGLFVIGCPLSR